MELIADILLIAGAIGAAFYCIVLSRRLSRFTDLEKGVGGAIAVLSAQVDDMTKMLNSAQGAATGSSSTLQALTGRAEDVAKRLELLVASMHDLPTGAEPAAAQPAEPAAQKPAESTPDATAEPDPAEVTQSLFRSARRETEEVAA